MLAPIGKSRIRLRALPAALPQNIELQETATAIQWRYVGQADDTWQTLIEIDDITASVEIGSVTTLDPGDSATVTNSGTEREVVLDFGIPPGNDGLVQGVTAGAGIDVDDTDPANPVVAVETNLQTWNGIAPSANVQSIVSAADYAAIRTLLSLVVGTNVQAYDALLASFAGLTVVAAGKFPRFSAADTVVAQDIVGTVSQSSGTPTGALFEFGAGYLKLPGGFMLQYGTSASSASANTTVTFPVAFAVAPTGVFGQVNSTAGADADTTTRINTYTTTDFQMDIRNASSARIASTMVWLAIGKWHA